MPIALVRCCRRWICGCWQKGRTCALMRRWARTVTSLMASSAPASASGHPTPVACQWLAISTSGMAAVIRCVCVRSWASGSCLYRARSMASSTSMKSSTPMANCASKRTRTRLRRRCVRRLRR